MTIIQSERYFQENLENGWSNTINVDLVREQGKSFGICIVGGKVNLSADLQISGIFIKNIIAGTPADVCRQIKIGDRILSVNGTDVRNATQDETINLIKLAGCTINFDIQSFNDEKLQKQSNEHHNVNSSNMSNKPMAPMPPQTETKTAPSAAAAPPSVTPIKRDNVTTSQLDPTTHYSSEEEDDDQAETAGKIETAGGMEIDRRSAGNLKRSRQEIEADTEKEDEFGYTILKIKKKYGQLGNILRIEVNRDPNNCLGLALAGNRDRNELSSFVAGINPKGSAKDSDLRPGDEIIEINGTVLYKRCHLNTAVAIKGMPEKKLLFIVLRRDTSKQAVAVGPITAFPVATDEIELLQESYASANVRCLTVQKIGPSLGIMIVEGKHADVGQGIFISDIQENSNAERAGLVVGEMILAVNKDLLIECKYDKAAELLKRVEGVVTLTVCNPNKEKQEQLEREKAEKAARIAEKKKEVIQDPAVAEIFVNRCITIEVTTNKKVLGVHVRGGKDSFVEGGASVIYIHPGGAVEADKRLKIYDLITDINGVKITNELSQYEVYKLFKRYYDKVRMIVYRADPVNLNEVSISIQKKPGKDLGVEFVECKDIGLLVRDINPGGLVDLDKNMLKNDLITHINNEDIHSLHFGNSTALIRASPNKIDFKVVRPKGKAPEEKK